MGYTYADTATATLIRDKLRELVVGSDALDNTGIWQRMVQGSMTSSFWQIVLPKSSLPN